MDEDTRDLCDWCRQPMRVGEECRIAHRRHGLPLFWHLECFKVGVRPFVAPGLFKQWIDRTNDRPDATDA